jgi:hypothetical protein
MINACSSTATEIIIFGCLNQHINELPVCVHHSRVWIETMQEPGLSCSHCWDNIDNFTWIIIQTPRIKKDYIPRYMPTVT